VAIDLRRDTPLGCVDVDVDVIHSLDIVVTEDESAVPGERTRTNQRLTLGGGGIPCDASAANRDVSYLARCGDRDEAPRMGAGRQQHETQQGQRDRRSRSPAAVSDFKARAQDRSGAVGLTARSLKRYGTLDHTPRLSGAQPCVSRGTRPRRDPSGPPRLAANRRGAVRVSLCAPGVG
jgi:hypothetical protein